MTINEDGGSSLFFDAIATRYDELTSADPRHALVRGAFQSLVLETVAPGSLLLDFGCGTGTDALWYAERGYQVIAYDSSGAMIEELKTKCSARIARREIIPYHAGYDEFLKQRLQPRPIAVVSNFAVLSNIPDLPRLFGAWAEQVAPRGHAIVSVLNPFFWENMLRRSWWKNYVRSLGKGRILQALGDRPDVYQYFPATVTAAASPHFVKTRCAGVGAFTGGKIAHQASLAPESLGDCLERRFWKTRPIQTIGQFIFFVFQKCA